MNKFKKKLLSMKGVNHDGELLTNMNICNYKCTAINFFLYLACFCKILNWVVGTHHNQLRHKAGEDLCDVLKLMMMCIVIES